MKTTFTLAFFALLFTGIAFPGVSFAQAGSLDDTFSSDGKVTTDIGNFTDVAKAVAIQSDGKIVTAGYSYNGSDYDFAVVRYNTDGTLDNTFDADGIVTTAIGTSDDYCYSVAIQPDGKIVAAGYTNNGTNDDFATVRYNADGSLDNTFDSDGKIITVFDSLIDWGYSVAIQGDGKIIVAGSSMHPYFSFALVRYNEDGSLDTSFSSDGKVTTNFQFDNGGRSLALQDDGKIVVLGWNHFASASYLTIVRYNSDGNLDSTFAFNGIPFGLEQNTAIGHSVVLQGDGKILVVANKTGRFVPAVDFALVRFLSTGYVDTNFGSIGRVFIDFAGDDDYSYSVAAQSDGKIVMAGWTSPGNFAIARINSDGSLDGPFGTNGKVTTDFGGVDKVYSIAIQNDGKIVAAGVNSDDFAVARYNVTGGLDDLIIYPNPGNGILQTTFFEFQKADVEIYNVVGARVYRSSYFANQLITIDVSGLEGGIYFVVIKDEKGSRRVTKYIKI